MDLSAITIIIVMTAMFFGAIVWMAIHSRKTGSRELPSEKSGTGFGDE